MSGKRGKGEGSVRRLPSGSWQSQVMDGYTDEGKRHIVCFTACTRAEALDKMKEYADSNDGCMVQRLLSALGEELETPCGRCTCCQKARRQR